MSLHLLADPAPAFIQLLRPLLKAQTIPSTLIVVLLDWSEAWAWLRKLRTWLRLLRPLLDSLNDDCKEAMDELMADWQNKSRASGAYTGEASGTTALDTEGSTSLGQGEWDDPLGLPLCVVCQNVSHLVVTSKL